MGSAKFAGPDINVFTLEHPLLTWNTYKCTHMTFWKNYKVFEVKNRAEIISDTIKFFPYKYPMMESYTENVIRKAAKGIIEYLQYLKLEVPMKTIGKKQRHDLGQLVQIMLEYTLGPSTRV